MKSICNFKPSKPITLYKYWNLWGKALIGAQWLFTGKGLGASNQFEACGFHSHRKAGVEYPDIQYHFLPIAVRYDGKVAAGGHGFQVHTGPMRSASRGAVTLRSGRSQGCAEDPVQLYVATQDWEDFRTAIRLTREIFAQPAMAEHVKARNPAGDGSANGRASWMLSCENTSKAPITPAAPAGWGGPTIRWRWSTPNVG